MKIGLIGLPNSGKTTIFNALSRSEAEVTSFANTRAEPNLAVIDVEDERIDKLSGLYQPKKTVRATVELVDFVGLSEGSAREGLFSGEAMALVRNADALAMVIRRFTDSASAPRRRRLRAGCSHLRSRSARRLRAPPPPVASTRHLRRNPHRS